MKVYRIVKRFKELTTSEERGMGATLNAGDPAIEIIRAYLEGEVTNLDGQLNEVNSLYTASGDNHTHVATLLAQRATYIKLRNLITEKVVVDKLDDQSEEV